MKKTRAWQWLVVFGVMICTQGTGLASPQATGGTSTNTYMVNGTKYIVHIFTEGGTFVPDNELEVEYLVVAGGGGGGADYFSRGGGGGGAGGFLANTSLSLPVDTYTIVVGAGGAGGSGASGEAQNGGDSSITNAALTVNIVATGGGGGGNSKSAGAAGGSGGGGGSQNGSAGGAGEAGQGNDGGAGNGASTIQDSGGGGGGAGGPGGDAGVGVAGVGGAGLSSSIRDGTPVTYAAGGNGSVYGEQGTVTDEDDNTGNGGDSVEQLGNDSPGGAGGSGIVVIRYVLPPAGTVIIIK